MRPINSTFPTRRDSCFVEDLGTPQIPTEPQTRPGDPMIEIQTMNLEFIPDNQCPGCGSLMTLSHITLWKYFCAVCQWGFGHPTNPRNYENERYDSEREAQAQEEYQ